MSKSNIGKLAIIGAGAMGSAFARGLIAAGAAQPENIVFSDIDDAKLSILADSLGVRAVSGNKKAVESADIVMIAVKPPVAKGVLEEISATISKGQVLISIVAGLKIDAIESALPGGIAVIRAMPNTPCQVGLGAVGFCRGSSANDRDVEIARSVFDASGISVEVPERLMDAVTGLSGSGPAYVYLIIEALSDAGVRVGLPREVSLKLASQTVLGAARMVIETGEHPARLKDQVTTPGGTTITGLETLERAGLRSALIEAVKSATKRSEELS